jgi:hypothetical protein
MGSADEKRLGLTQKPVAEVVEKIFKKFSNSLKIRCILQGFADLSGLFEKSSGSLKTYSR